MGHIIYLFIFIYLFIYLLAQIKVHTIISTDTNNMEIVLIGQKKLSEHLHNETYTLGPHTYMYNRRLHTVVRHFLSNPLNQYKQ